jgi:replication factor A1
MLSLDEILGKIQEKSGITKEELMSKIEKKQKDLFGLVSTEGAAYLIAKEHGIELSDNEKKLQIRDIVGGMKKINFSGRVFRTTKIIEFKRSDGSIGKVVNVYLGDSTGFIKLVLWDKQVKLVEDETIKLGDTIEAANGSVKENVYGDVEVTIGRFGSIRAIDDLGFPSIEELNRKFSFPTDTRIQINDIVPGNFEIRGTIMRVFKGKFIFKTCSICESVMEETTGKPICVEHGEAEYNPCLVVTTIIDDGTGDIRTVFFRDLAEKLIGISAGEINNLDLEKRYEVINERLLGKEILVKGRIRKNKMFDRLEMTANEYKDINILEESKRLLEELKSKIAG